MHAGVTGANKKYKMMENKGWQDAISGTIEIKVTPRAASTRIVAEAAPQGGWHLKVYVTCAPEDGKANEAVISALAKELRLPKSAIAIVRGHSNRTKLIEITR